MRAVVLFDGQTLYHLAKDCWGEIPRVPGSRYGYPSYDVIKLAKALVERREGRILSEIRFYTGVPHPSDDARWHGFWNNKLRFLGSQGVYVYRGRINPNGEEKGVDVSLAVDLLRLTYEKAYEVAIIVSQDWDFGPAVKLAKEVARDQGRKLTFESAFPYFSKKVSYRGVPGTEWVWIDKAMYDGCFDPTDYRA